MTLPASNKSPLYSIVEIANILHLSQHTLRNWEREGKITPSYRTPQGHRRYTEQDLDKLRKIQAIQNNKINEPAITKLTKEPILRKEILNTKVQPTTTFEYSKPNKVPLKSIFRVATGMALTVLTLAFVYAKQEDLGLPYFNLDQIGPVRLIGNGNGDVKGSKFSFEKPIPNSNVLAEETENLQKTLTFNIDTYFKGFTFFDQDVTVNNKNLTLGTGQLTASNVIYSILPGAGIGITPGQTPTITNTGVVSFQGLGGALVLTEGDGIEVNGLEINNVATLEDVTNNGGCSSCVTDDDVDDNLTISSDGNVSGDAITSGTVGPTVGGTGITSYTTGDVIYASATNTLSTLPIGSNGQVLTVNPSGVPFWNTSASNAWSVGIGFIYPTTLTDDVIIGGNDPANASFHFDESAANLFLGTNESQNGVLTLYSSGVGITDPNLTTNSSGDLIINSNNFDTTATGINNTAIGTDTRSTGAFTTLGANSTVTFSAYTSNGGLLYTNALGALQQVTAGAATETLHGGVNPFFAEVALGTETSGNYVATITGGAGLTGSGTGESSTPTLAVGAGNGISVNADDVTIDATTTGVTTTTASNSGLEVTVSGLRMIGGCADSEILGWNSVASAWMCNTVTGLGGGGGDITAVGDVLTGTAFSETAGNDGTTLFFEGSTIDTNEVALTSGDPGSDIIVTLPTITGTLASLAGTQIFTGDKTFTGTATFSNTTTVNGTLAANGIINLGDGGDAITVLGSTISLSPSGAGNDISINLVDDNTDALDIQEGVRNYININTSNGTENIAFGNATNNPSVSFLGTGTITVANFGTGIVHSNSSGVLSSSAVNLNSADVTGILQPANGGTGASTLNDLITLGTHTTGNYVATITAGGGLTGTVATEGSTPTLAVGAGNGITVNADDITIDATTTGTTSTTASNSGLEVTAGGLRLLGGCSDTEVLSWSSSASAWTCSPSSAGSLTTVGDSTGGTSAFTGANNGNTLTFEGTVNDANDIAVTAANPAASRTYTLPDLGTDGTFAFLEGTQTFTGNKTFNGTSTFNTDVDFAFAGAENIVFTNASASTDQLAITTTIADTNSVNAISLNITDNTATSGTGRGIFIQTGDGTASLDSALAINHTDTGQALTSGIAITGAASTTITTAVDLSDAEIATALALGSNDVTVGGATISSTEFALLDGRSGTLVDSANVATFATTGVTAGSGLTGGGTVGVLTVNIGAGNGITVNADDITIDATTTGTTSTTASNSGLEVTASGLRILGGCSDNQVLTWNTGNSVWMCNSVTGAGAGDITAVGDVLSGAAFTQTAGNDGTTLFFEGATADTNEIALTTEDPGADITVTIPNIAGTLASLAGTQTFTGDKTFNGTSTFGGTATFNTDADFSFAGGENITLTNSSATTDQLSLSVSGVVDDAIEALSVSFTQEDDGDNTDTNAGISVNLTSNSGDSDLFYGVNIGVGNTSPASAIGLRIGANFDSQIEFEGATNNSFETFLTLVDPTDDRTITIPDESGVICLSSGNCAGSAGGTKWTDAGTITYLTHTTDNLAVGGVDNTSEFFIDIANGGTLALLSTADTENVFSISDVVLTTGSAISATSANNSSADTAWSANLFNATNSQDVTAVTTGSIAGLNVQFTQGTLVSGNTETVAKFNVAQNDTISVDSAVSSLISLANNDTATGNQITVTDGINITGTNITNGINLSGTFATNLITSTNFTVTQAGNITTAGTLAVNGDTITSDSNLTVSATGYVKIGDTGTPGVATADDDLYVQGNLEIDGTTLDAASVTTFTCTDCINFDDISDSPSLDANLALAQGTNTWSQTYTGTGATGYTYTASGALTAGNAAFDINVSNAGTSIPAFMITNAGQSLALRVNDDGTATDTTSFVIDATGQVGIGTTAPSSILHINNSSTVGDITSIQSTTTQAAAAGSIRELLGGFGAGSVVGGAGIGGVYDYSAANGTQLALYYSTTGNVVTEGARINKSGNMGIGSTSPDARLHVVGGDSYIAPDGGYTFNNASANEDLYVFGNLEVDGTIFGATISATDLTCTDCLDFTDFEDTLDLDAALTLNQSTNTWSQTYTGTSSTGLTYTATSLTTGSALNVVATNTATTDTALSGIKFDLTNAQDSTANLNGVTGLAVNFTNNPTVAGNAEYALRIQNQATTNTTDNAVSALLLLDNADTTATGTTVITDAIKITNSGGSGFTNFLETPTIDISALGAISGATGISSSGTITFSGLSTGVVINTAGTLASEAQLALARGGTAKALTAVAGAVVYTDADSFEVSAAGILGQCLISGGAGAPTWDTCSASAGFTSSGGIITKVDPADRVSLIYGDAGDVQLTIENTTNSVLPTADSMQIDLTGGTAGITTDGVDGLSISTEFGNGTANTNSGIHLDINPVNSPSGDETFYGLNIDGITASSAAESAINIGTNWDTEINLADTTPTIAIGNSGTLSITDGSNTLLTLADGGTTGNLTTSGNLAVNGNTTFGDTNADTVTSNAASWTFANDTNFVLSGGANGLSFDTSTLSVDATADRIGIGTTAPATILHVVGTTEQLRLGYDGSNTTSFTVSSSGNLTLNTSGTTVSVSDKLISSAHAANQGLTLPTNAGTPAGVSGTTEGDAVWDSTNDKLYVYNGSAFVQIGGSGGGECSSGACTSVLYAEYPNSIITADGSNNTGTFTSDSETHETNYVFNYDEFTSTQSSLQDYDIWVSWRIPKTFSAFTTGADTSLTVDIATEDTSSSNNKVDVTIQKQGAAGTETDTANVSAVAADWQTAISGDSGSAVVGFDEGTSCANCLGDLSFTAGDTMIIKIKLYSKDNFYSRVGAVTINWNTN